jgi:hypothetical protein
MHGYVLLWIFLSSIFLIIYHSRRMRGTRPQVGLQSLQDCSKVYCPNCKENIPNPKNTPEDRFIRCHFAQKKCCDETLIHKQKDSAMVTFPPGLHFGMLDHPDLATFVEEQGYAPDSDYNSASYSSDDNSSEEEEELEDEESLVSSVWSEDEEPTCDDALSARDLGLLDEVECFKGTKHHLKGCDAIYSPVQILKSQDLLKGFDINVLRPCDAIFDIQSTFLKLYEKESVVYGKSMKFRNMGVTDGKEEVRWEDLMDLLEFGLSAGMSDAVGDGLLETIDRILQRHKSPIQLRKTWKSMRKAVDKQKLSKGYTIANVRYMLPPEFFGTSHYLTGRDLKCFEGTARDIREVVAEMLLDADPDKIILRHIHDSTSDDILGNFPSGLLFRQFSKDAEAYGDIDGLPVVPLCFGVWGDEATVSANRNKSELPIYLSLLNAIEDAYKLEFVGYAPFRLPYSEETLHKQMKSVGLKQKNHRVNILKRTKRKVVRDYMVNILNTIGGLGNNCFRVQIGRGHNSVTVLALIHICQFGGDGMWLDGLCGCYHSRGSFCRMCLERRRGLFTKTEKVARRRIDDQMEKLAYDFDRLQKRIVDTYVRGGRFGSRKRYKKTDRDCLVEAQALKYSIDAGDNRLYELFYYANIRGIGTGFHGSCWPDMLHVVLKGIVEKNLSFSLALIFGMHRLIGEDFSDGMAIMDNRVQYMVAIPEFNKR